MFKILIVCIAFLISSCVTDSGGRLLDPATPCTVHSFTFECAHKYNISSKRLEERSGVFVSRGAYARLSVQNFCTTEGTTWGFHGAINMSTGEYLGSEGWNRFMIQGLRPRLREELIRRGVLNSNKIVSFSGREIIDLGYPKCN